MGSHIVEITASGYLRLESPRQWGAVFDCIGIGLAQRLSISYLNVEHLTNLTTVYYILNLLEIRQVTAIISHKTRYSRLLRDTVDAGTVFVTRSQRLLNIYRFAGFHGHDGISGMTRWRCGHIYGIHIRIIDQTLGIGIPFGYVMLHGIGTGTLFCTAHHGHHTRALYLAEGRTAFEFGHLATTNKTPR